MAVNFVDFAAVLAFADRRMVVCDLLNLAGSIGKGASRHLADGDVAVFERSLPSGHRPCPASPHFPLRAENLIICNSYGFPNAIGRGSSRAFESGS